MRAFSHKSESMIFIAWRSYTIKIRARKRQLLDKTLKRLSLKSLYTAFRQWY